MDKKFYLIFSAIALINLFVYFPSFSHISRSDNEVFLAEVAELNSLPALIQYSYSYTRTRLFAAGDAILFRPLYYVVLSLEKWLFGYHFMGWQITSFLLHLGVVWQLLRILFRISENAFSFLFVLLFSVLTIPEEMVIWSHVASYLLVMILILKSLSHFVDFIESDYKQDGHIYWICFYTALGSFLYETTLVTNLIFMGWVMLVPNKNSAQKMKTFFSLGIPVIFYAVVSFMDYQIHRAVVTSAVQTFSAEPLKVVLLFLKMFILSFNVSFLPLVMKLWLKIDSDQPFADRVAVDPQAHLNILVIFGTIVTIGLIIFWIKKWRALDRKNSLFSILGLAFSLGYLAVIVLGRLNARGEDYFNSNLYYFYPLALFNTIFLYSLLAQSLQKKSAAAVAVAVLSLLILLNAYQTYSLNQKIKQQSQDIFKLRALSPELFYLSQKYLAHGLIEYKNGQVEAALADYNQALTIDPTIYQAYGGRGLIYQWQKQNNLALADLTKALKLNPKYIEAYNNRGLLFKHNGQYDLAIADFSAAISLAPEHYEAFNNRGLIYSELKQFDQALNDLNRTIFLEKDYPGAYNNRGLVYKEQGRYNLAIADYTHAIDLKPDYTEAYSNRGNACALQGRYALAIEDYSRALALDDRFVTGYRNRALIYQQMGQQDLAQKDFEKAAQLQKGAE